MTRAHGVNANQVFGGRRLYPQGRLKRSIGETTALFPVRVVDEAATDASEVSTPHAELHPSDSRRAVERTAAYCPVLAAR